MKTNGISIFSVLFYTAAMAAAIIVVFSCTYSYAAFAKKYAAANAPILPNLQITNVAPAQQALQPRSVKFTYKSYRAREVFLAAEFNLWGQHKLKMESNGAGTFSKTVILPPGRYKYIFNVDGKEIKDPAAIQTAFFEGKEVSVRIVL